MSMHVQAAAAGVMICLAAVHPVQNTGIRTYTVHSEDTEGNAVAGAVYGFYKDAECTIPLLSPYGTQVLLNDENKEQTLFNAEEVWIKEIQAPYGCYLLDEPLSFTEDDTVSAVHHKITIETELPDNSEASLYLDEEQYAVWNGEKWVDTEGNEIVFRAGDILKLSVTGNEWTYFPEKEIVIPQYYSEEENPVVFKTEGKLFGVITVPEEFRECTFALYADEEGKMPAEEVNGEDASGKNEYRMETGDYYLKWMDTPEDYWTVPEMSEVHLNDSQKTTADILLEKPEISLYAADALTGNSLSGTWTVTDCITQEKMEVYEKSGIDCSNLKREHQYEISFLISNGYYPCSPVTIEVPAEKTELSVQISCRPVLIQVQVKDSTDGTLLHGLTYELYKEGRPVLSWQTEQTVHGSCLKTGTAYELRIAGLPDDYLPADQSVLFIPENADYTVQQCLKAVPYVRFYGPSLQGSTVTLYKDEKCTERAEDIFGIETGGKTEYSLFNGTYYAKLSDIPSGWYADDTVYQVAVNHASSPVTMLETEFVPVSVSVHVFEDDQNYAEGALLVLNDENGKEIRRWVSNGNESVPGVLSRNTSYTLQVISAPGLYTYDHTPVSFRTAEYAQDHEVTAEIHLESYVSWSVTYGTQAGISCGLYQDRNCTEYASDIHGQPAYGETDEDGMICFLMRPGIYWFKADCADSRILADETPELMVIDGNTWTVKLQREVKYLQFSFGLLDQKDRYVCGAEMELLDENGSVIYTWTSKEELSVTSGEFLEKGKEYSIRMRKAPEGYEKTLTSVSFSLPSSLEEDMPVIRMQIKEKENGTSVSRETVMTAADTGQAGKHVFPYALISFITLLAAALLVFVKQRKKK